MKMKHALPVIMGALLFTGCNGGGGNNNGNLKNNVDSPIDLARVKVFLDSDRKEVEELVLSSKYLKKLFYTLVDNIDKIITLSNKYNNLKLPSILQQVGIRCLKLI